MCKITLNTQGDMFATDMLFPGRNFPVDVFEMRCKKFNSCHLRPGTVASFIYIKNSNFHANPPSF